MDQYSNTIQKKKVKLDIKKSDIMNGSERETHYSKRTVSCKNACFTFRCKCKCYSKFTEQFKFAFN